MVLTPTIEKPNVMPWLTKRPWPASANKGRMSNANLFMWKVSAPSNGFPYLWKDPWPRSHWKVILTVMDFVDQRVR